jgi:hypothetical protein
MVSYEKWPRSEEKGRGGEGKKDFNPLTSFILSQSKGNPSIQYRCKVKGIV